MILYSTSDDISFTITQGDASVTDWSLWCRVPEQAISFGDITFDEDASVLVAHGSVRGNTTLHLTETIARYLSNPFCMPEFACKKMASGGVKPSAAFWPDRGSGSSYTQRPDDQGAHCFRLSTLRAGSTGRPSNNDFEVWRNQVAALKPSSPIAASQTPTTNTWQDQGILPLCLNQPVDNTIYDSSWSMQTQVTVLNAGATPDNRNNALKKFGVYFIAYAEGSGTVKRPEAITWADLYNGDVIFGNDIAAQQTDSLYMLAYWDNWDSYNWPAQGSSTESAWNPYIIGECSIADYMYSASGSYAQGPDSSSMPYWDPHKGQGTAPNRALNPAFRWTLYLLTVGGVYYSSSIGRCKAKWTKLGTYDPCKPVGAVQVRYINQYGAIDSLWMTSVRRTTVNRAPETYQRNVAPGSYEHSITPYQQEIRYEYTLNTPVLDDRQSRLLMMHLFQSPAIWIYDESLIENDLYPENTQSSYMWNTSNGDPQGASRFGLVPVNLKDTSMTVKTKANDKVFNYTLTFESANPLVKF